MQYGQSEKFPELVVFPELVLVYMRIKICRGVIKCRYTNAYVRARFRGASYVMGVVLPRHVAVAASAAGLGRKAGLRARAVAGRWQARPAGGRVHRNSRVEAAGSADEDGDGGARRDRRRGRPEALGGPQRAGRALSLRRESDGAEPGAAVGIPKYGASEGAW